MIRLCMRFYMKICQSELLITGDNDDSFIQPSYENIKGELS